MRLPIARAVPAEKNLRSSEVATMEVVPGVHTIDSLGMGGPTWPSTLTGSPRLTLCGSALREKGQTCEGGAADNETGNQHLPLGP